jgi:hypothetical protein
MLAKRGRQHIGASNTGKRWYVDFLKRISPVESARSDLKGHEVGTRSAEPPRHPHSHLRGQAVNSQNRTWGPSPRWSGQFPRLEDEPMCWFSAEHANKIEEAKAGQRLGIKKMTGDSNW